MPDRRAIWRTYCVKLSAIKYKTVPTNAYNYMRNDGDGVRDILIFEKCTSVCKEYIFV